MVGIPAKPTLVDATEYQKSFVPYGTCSESHDPQVQKLEWLQGEVERLRKDIAALREEQDVRSEQVKPDRRTIA
jgi:serine O-acetyltransferase